MTRWFPPIWKMIPWARRYAVSDRGEVRNARGLMKLQPNDEGYLKVQLVEDSGAVRNVFVHKLVAELFLPPPKPGDRYVLHRDHQRTNCHASNLRWGTHADNHADKLTNGTARRGCVRKLTWNAVRAIRASNKSTPELARLYQLSVSHVREIRNGRKWAWLDESRQERLAL